MEMESAGLFAIGQVRGVQNTSVIVIMDSLATLQWEVPDRLDRIQKGLEIAYEAAVDTLSRPT